MGLMFPYVPNGKWLRHEDWQRINESAKDPLQFKDLFNP